MRSPEFKTLSAGESSVNGPFFLVTDFDRSAHVFANHAKGYPIRGLSFPRISTTPVPESMARRKRIKGQATGSIEKKEVADPLRRAGQSDGIDGKPLNVGDEASDRTDPSTQKGADSPSAFTRTLVSGLVIFHLSALFFSYSAIIEPSSTHSAILNFLTPYLRLTHFAADGRPFYLAHGTQDEQPHRLQVASDQAARFTIDSETQWTTVEPTGVAGLGESDRYHRWMTLAASLSESDQLSLVALMLKPLASADENTRAVRIIRLPTQLTTVEQDSVGPAYLARAVREGDQTKLVSIESKRLTTFSPTEVER